MFTKYVALVLVISAGSAHAAEKPKTWTAMSVYSDGRLVINEGLHSERICREALCLTKNSTTCAEKGDADAKTKIEAQKREAEEQKREEAFRVDHPCTKKMDGYLHCPLPGGEELFYDKDGKGTNLIPLLENKRRFVSSGSGVSLRITKQVCFQE